jgi:hypothetical protein
MLERFISGVADMAAPFFVVFARKSKKDDFLSTYPEHFKRNHVKCKNYAS